MLDARNQLGNDEEPGSQGANAAVDSAGEPSGSLDTRDLSGAEDQGPSPEELDAREENFTAPRKEMGPTGGGDVPETSPEEG